ncbi:E3 ubiquitin-protein like [Actinidia chinensis var. chinensis]|uniref:E3 ubiquitin-protein like n=1 Tax=Actinidia chinensis var. chinensis TaxID=1590841 RepID=A0A2R6P4E2_ACTCC|nr:E3 ubiquitin-protein like [Actinidia chinensis var. chinensis]
MGDHFVLLVDRLLTEATLEAAIESRKNLSKQLPALKTDEIKIDCSSHEKDSRDCSSPLKVVECRICQDEDEDSNMETPCSCCGSLKYAHRGCVQRWCDEKGDTVCEICHQPFKPGYTAPPPMFQLGNIPMNFRGNWAISRRDLNNPRIIAMVSADRNFLRPDYDEYTASASRSLLCFRSVAVIFMVLLILRHTLPVIVGGVQNYSLPLFLLLLLRTSGVILPIYLMLRAVNAIKRRQRQPGGLQESPSVSDTASDEEAGLLLPQHQPQLIRVH